MVRKVGLEPTIFALSERCTNLLCYSRIWWTIKDLNLGPESYELPALDLTELMVQRAAQPALEGGLPLEFPVVTPQVVGPDVKALDKFILLKGDENL